MITTLFWKAIGLLLRLLLIVAGIAPCVEVIGQQAIEVQVYSSLVMSASTADAVAWTQPMVNLLGRRVGHPTVFGVRAGGSLADLVSFGKDISEGKCHIGVLWGLEYGWLKEHHPGLDLEPLAVVSNGEAKLFVQLMVRRDLPVRDLKSLRGKRLAWFKREPLMYQMSLEKILGDEGFETKDFFAVIRGDYQTARDALAALKNNEADCVLIDNGQFASVRKTWRGLAEIVYPLRKGPVVPHPVLVGRVKKVEAIRKGLWRELMEELPELHKSDEGAQCVAFWQFQQFEKVPRDFEQGVKEAAEALKLEARHYQRGNQ